MKADDLCLLIQKELQVKQIKWRVSVIAGVVFIKGQSQSQTELTTLATIDFLNGPSHLNIKCTDKEIEKIIIAIYDKFQVMIDDDVTEDDSGIHYLIYIAAGAALSFCLVAAGFIYAICNYQLPK